MIIFICNVPFYFYKSFYAENHQRFFHLSNSLDRLDSKQNTLKGYLNLLRQEEITEEIQIIMLSAEAVIGNDIINSKQAQKRSKRRN